MNISEQLLNLVETTNLSPEQIKLLIELAGNESVQTSAEFLAGGAVLKLIIDLFAFLIPVRVRPLIPIFAAIIGVAWCIIFFELPLAEEIILGIGLAATAVYTDQSIKGVREVVDTVSEKKKDITAVGDFPQKDYVK